MNSSSPFVSVIVPNYNHAKFLRARLDSILNQTFQDFELILLDDCSTDNSVEILQPYAGHSRVSHFVVNDQNSGSPFVQWERGISLARGEFVWIAESDDWADPQLLERLLAILDQNHRAGVSVCRSTVVDSADTSLGIWEDHLTDDVLDSCVISGRRVIADYCVRENIIPNASAAVVRRRSFEHVDWDQLSRFRLNGDWLCWIRILEHTDLAFVNWPGNFFRKHDATSRATSTSVGINWLEGLRVLEYISTEKLAGQQDVEETAKKFFEKVNSLGLSGNASTQTWRKSLSCAHRLNAVSTVEALRSVLRFGKASLRRTITR
jgi:glycosyltransferase involved in cell wall biosynthesis